MLTFTPKTPAHLDEKPNAKASCPPNKFLLHHCLIVVFENGFYFPVIDKIGAYQEVDGE